MHPTWVRRHRLGHIPEIWDDRVYFIDKPHSQGWQRDWFIEVLFERKIVPVWVMSQSFQTSGTSVTLSGLSFPWNNVNNYVEGIGGGGSGGITQNDTTSVCTGGGGAEYRQIRNFADPGGATPMVIGQGGPAVAGTAGVGGVTIGQDGTATTWNTASLIANPGLHGLAVATSSATNGGTGGTGGTGADANNAGGRGGNETGWAAGSTGGGGAGGPNGAGANGVDTNTTGSTAGGQGDVSKGGAGGNGTTSTPGGAGTAGTELGDGVHGCGGGGGSCRVSANSAAVAGSGALYGAGGGACWNSGSGGGGSTKSTSGAGANGLIVLTSFPFIPSGMFRKFM